MILFKDTIQQLFEAEMDEHLGYSKHHPDGDHTGNRVLVQRLKLIKDSHHIVV